MPPSVLGFVDYVGFNGPAATALVTTVALANRPLFLCGFWIFYISERHLTGFIKTIIREPRPLGYDLDKFKDDGYYTGLDQYGMPSQHSAGTWLATLYTFMVSHNPHVLALQLMLTYNTMRQRYMFHKHYLHQLGAGGVLGAVLAWSAFSLFSGITGSVHAIQSLF
jgi:membrane-associated phospholipid phosphatase